VKRAPTGNRSPSVRIKTTGINGKRKKDKREKEVQKNHQGRRQHTHKPLEILTKKKKV